VKIQTTKGA